jgi:hypothetical protein
VRKLKERKKMMRKVVFVLGFLLAAVSAKANAIYFTQNGTGTGASCTDPKGVSFFNDPANWGVGKAIPPGWTLHLCGTFTGTAGQQLLTVQGSGASGSPITILFETGAVLTAPYFSSQGAINANGKSFITVDGGTNGIIQNTANGSTLANHVSSRGIYMPSCANCVVQNLTIANLYVRTSTTDVFLGSASDVNCIYYHLASPFTINNVTCHDAGWGFAGDGSNLTIENSNVYNVDHGVAFGASATVSGISIHDNHFHDYAKWDTNPTTDKYHHDGIHMWAQNGTIVSDGLIYNNQFDGDPGTCCTTAHIFLQDQIENVAVFNNVILVHTTHTIQGVELAGETYTPTGNAAYNNYFQLSDTHGPGGEAALFARKQANFTAINNVLIGGQTDISVVEGGSLSSAGIDYELYDDLYADYGDLNAFGWQGTSYHTLASWQAACHCDGHSLLVPFSQINADTNGHLLTGSKGIGLGENLVQNGVATGRLAPLAKDKNGVARPTTGAWDVGAYVH